MATLPQDEIGSIERKLGLMLPALYRRLLLEKGPGKFGDLQIYHPGEVRECYESFFADPSQLFDLYFPFGCDNRKQELWIIDARAEKAASIWHETVPEDWPDEDWLPYEHWIERHLGSGPEGMLAAARE